MRFSSLLRRRPSAPLVDLVRGSVRRPGRGRLCRHPVAGEQRRQRPAEERQRRQLEAQGQRSRRPQDHQRIGRGQAGQLERGPAARRRRPARPARSRRSGCPAASRCTPTLPNEVGTSAAAVTLGASVDARSPPSRCRPGRSYLVLAYPHAVISGGAGSASASRSTARCRCRRAPRDHDHDQEPRRRPRIDANSQAGTIPLVLPVALGDERPDGHGELHRHRHAEHAGADGGGRHDASTRSRPRRTADLSGSGRPRGGARGRPGAPRAALAAAQPVDRCSGRHDTRR